MDDLDWGRDRVVFRAHKRGKQSVLPLTLAVGESLLDYLKHGRAQSVHGQVFLTCRAPYPPLTDSDAVSMVVKRRMLDKTHPPQPTSPLPGANPTSSTG